MTIFENWDSASWIILGLILLVGEIIIPGVFLLWFGLAALILAGLCALFAIPLTLSWIIYGILAIILSYLWWKYQTKRDKTDTENINLNQRAQRLVGQVGRVTQFDHGFGRARFGDSTWKIQGENLVENDQVIVISTQGITLTVKKYDS